MLLGRKRRRLIGEFPGPLCHKMNGTRNARVDPAIREMARRLFGFRNFNPLASSRELVGILERAVARRAKAQKARAREGPYWIRGKVGYLRVVFYGGGSRQYVRNYVVPRDPRTRHQARVRGGWGGVGGVGEGVDGGAAGGVECGRRQRVERSGDAGAVDGADAVREA